jgi:tetratricopeptide (TPR) repeat protein
VSSYKNTTFGKSVFTLLLCLFLYLPAHANTVAHCDSLIQRGVAAMWNKDHVKSMELLTEARSMAEKNRWYKQLFLANNNIGNNYYSLLDYGEALNYYLESYNIALKNLEPKYEMVVLNNIAILYSKEKNYIKAKEYFRKAYDIAKENKDNVKIGLYASNLGNVANEANRPMEAKPYFIESLPYLKNEPNLLMLAYIGLAENDLLIGNAKKAREKAQSLFNNATDLEYNDIGISLIILITKAYLKEGNYALAAANATKVLAKKPNLETKKTVFDLLARIYSKSGAFNDALKYKDSIINVEEKLNDIKNGRLFENNRVKFEIQNYKNEILVKEEKLSTERKLFYSILAVIIAIVTIIILSLRNISVKHKQRKLIAERNEKVITLELEKEKTENLLLEKQISEKETNSLLEQERLKNEIEARNRKLSAKALYLSGRNQLIEEVLSSLSQIPELSKNVSLAGHIKTLRSHLKTDDEWDSFITHFEEVNHGFINQLKILHPSLTANDIRFISYIYMNLSTKEIASMLNITAEACRKRKERIASKMELPENISLYDYLSTL